MGFWDGFSRDKRIFQVLDEFGGFGRRKLAVIIRVLFLQFTPQVQFDSALPPILNALEVGWTSVSTL